MTRNLPPTMTDTIKKNELLMLVKKKDNCSLTLNLLDFRSKINEIEIHIIPITQSGKFSLVNRCSGKIRNSGSNGAVP